MFIRLKAAVLILLLMAVGVVAYLQPKKSCALTETPKAKVCPLDEGSGECPYQIESNGRLK